jgi:hypothetical protein
VQCRNWLFNITHLNSISCNNVTYIFLLILLVTFDMISYHWGKRLIQICYILFRIYQNDFWHGCQFWLLFWQQSAWPLFFILNFSVWNLSPIFVQLGWHWWFLPSSSGLSMILIQFRCHAFLCYCLGFIYILRLCLQYFRHGVEFPLPHPMGNRVNLRLFGKILPHA